MSDGVDPAELWERYLEEIRADRRTPSPQGAMAFAVDALTTPPAAAQSNGEAIRIESECCREDVRATEPCSPFMELQAENETLNAQLEAARKALEEIPRLISSARYDEPANGSAENAWNAACDHIEEGIAALAALEKPQS